MNSFIQKTVILQCVCCGIKFYDETKYNEHMEIKKKEREAEEKRRKEEQLIAKREQLQVSSFLSVLRTIWFSSQSATSVDDWTKSIGESLWVIRASDYKVSCVIDPHLMRLVLNITMTVDQKFDSDVYLNTILRIANRYEISTKYEQDGKLIKFHMQIPVYIDHSTAPCIRQYLQYSTESIIDLQNVVASIEMERSIFNNSIQMDISKLEELIKFLTFQKEEILRKTNEVEQQKEFLRNDKFQISAELNNRYEHCLEIAKGYLSEQQLTAYLKSRESS